MNTAEKKKDEKIEEKLAELLRKIYFSDLSPEHGPRRPLDLSFMDTDDSEELTDE